MKVCPSCKKTYGDDCSFCPECGVVLTVADAPAPEPQPKPAASSYDHTAEFDPKDASDNKVLVLVLYLIGVLGLFIALLAGNDSPYVKFHIRQKLKLTLVSVLIPIATAVLELAMLPLTLIGIWTRLAWLVGFSTGLPAAAGIAAFGFVAVITIITFIRILFGKSVEPPVIRSIKLLK